MNKITKALSIMSVLALCHSSAFSQSVEHIMESIEMNNKALQAAMKINDAGKAEAKTEYDVDDPTIEFSPFFADGVKGMASSELVVKQGFAFPTVYASKRKSIEYKMEASDMQYLAARRDVLLEAYNLCMDMICLNQKASLLEKRKENADSLMGFFQKRLQEGDASVIEINKIKMEIMSLGVEISQNMSDRNSVLQTLTAMNGNEPVSLDAVEYPEDRICGTYESERDDLLASDLGLLSSEASLNAAAQDVNVSKQGWLPKFEVGYRRNTSLNEASNGVLVGATFPIFSNINNSRAAKARSESARLQHENDLLRAEAELKSGFTEVENLYSVLQTYDEELMRSTLDMLQKSVFSGQMSIIEYYREAENVYKNLTARMDLENSYRKAKAELYKNKL